MSTCRICRAALTPFLDFGRMPLADAFVGPEGFATEYFYPLAAAVCPGCAMVQLASDVDRERMFHGEYAFFSSTSRRMVAHFEAFAREALGRVTAADPLVVEIGSNDGSMLAEFARAGVRCLGVDPAANVVRAAEERGLRSVCDFFEERTALAIRESDGRADLVVAANCMCHLPYMGSVLRGVRELLSPTGLFAFEDPYLPDILAGGAFDQFYDEHVFYFSATSVARMLEQEGLALIGVEPQAVHGGSMRYLVSHPGAHPVAPSVSETLAREAALRLADPATYADLRRRVERIRAELPALLASLRDSGKRVVGYAATAKSATVLNYCGIGPELLPFVCDTTPAKQGKYTPGVHIPVRPHEDFAKAAPDYALLFAWNHAAEIFEKERAFRDRGGRFITYVPDIRIV